MSSVFIFFLLLFPAFRFCKSLLDLCANFPNNANIASIPSVTTTCANISPASCNAFSDTVQDIIEIVNAFESYY